VPVDGMSVFDFIFEEIPEGEKELHAYKVDVVANALQLTVTDMDLEAIEWLEGYLKNYRGTILVVSHDRTFLSNVTNKVFWLDRSNLRVSPKGFADFEEWSSMLLEQEERELRNRKAMVKG